MQTPPLPIHTLRSLALLLRIALLFARARATCALRTLFDRGRPPTDLVVTTSSGGAYSGVLVLDEGRVLGGIVRLAGNAPRITPASSASALDGSPRGPASRASPTFGGLFEARADDDDDGDADEPWRRR